ncbi:MAG: hypothetical protein AAFY98_07500 [Verrucomicrobiota bacterium]
MDASQYQLFRLWSGICSIGLNLGMIWAAFLASAFLPNLPGSDLAWGFPLYTAAIALFLLLAFLPFEILIGFAAESTYSRTQQSFSEWFADWFRGIGSTFFGLVFGICFFGFVGQLNGLNLAITCAAAIGLVLLLIFTLPNWAFAVGALPIIADTELESELNEELNKLDAPPVQLHILKDGDEEGVNGMILPFQPNALYLNRSATEELDANELAAMAIREQWFHRQGQSTLCVGIILTWTLAGILMAVTLPSFLLGNTTLLQSGLGGAAIMTTWTFLALFTWPPLNNKFMLDADQHLAEKIGAQRTMELLNKIQTLNETDFELGSAKEHVFHPIPSLYKRIQHLKETNQS